MFFFSHLNLLWLQSFAKVRHDTGQLRSIYEPIAILPELVIWNNPCHIFTLENYYFVEDSSPHQRPGRLPLFRPLHSQPLPTFWPKPLLEWTKVTYLITVPSQKPTPSLLWHGCCYVCMNELLVLPCSPSWPETQESWATQSHPYPPLPPYPDFFKVLLISSSVFSPLPSFSIEKRWPESLHWTDSGQRHAWFHSLGYLSHCLSHRKTWWHQNAANTR